jgi:hypothetical protein
MSEHHPAPSMAPCIVCNTPSYLAAIDGRCFDCESRGPQPDASPDPVP